MIGGAMVGANGVGFTKKRIAAPPPGGFNPVWVRPTNKSIGTGL